MPTVGAWLQKLPFFGSGLKCCTTYEARKATLGAKLSQLVGGDAKETYLSRVFGKNFLPVFRQFVYEMRALFAKTISPIDLL